MVITVENAPIGSITNYFRRSGICILRSCSSFSRLSLRFWKYKLTAKVARDNTVPISIII